MTLACRSALESMRMALDPTDARDPGAWASRPLKDLMAFLRRDHVRIGGQVRLLVEEGKGAGIALLSEDLDRLRTSMHDHMEKEEEVLFPLIASGHGWSTGAISMSMELEHGDHSRWLHRIVRAAEDAAPRIPDLALRLRAFEAVVLEHIVLESKVLFPRAILE